MIGIYKITNTVNNKVYIGASSDIKTRWGKHRHKHTSKYLKADIEKYGLDKFVFEVIREIKLSPLTNIFLDLFEKKYIAEHKSYDDKYGYNKTFGGKCGTPTDDIKKIIGEKNSLNKIRADRISKSRKGMKFSIEHRKHIGEGGRGRIPWNKGKKLPPLTEEHKLKIAKANTNPSIEKRIKISEAGKNRIHTEASKQKMRISKIGKPCSEETKLKISETLKGKNANRIRKEII